MTPDVQTSEIKLTGREKARMERVAHAIVTSDRGSAVFFVLLAVGLVAFGLYMLGQAILFANELRLLRSVMAVLSVGFAGALIYEALALWTHRYHTISEITDAAFKQHQYQWIAVFGALMFGVGILALHFTRVAPSSSALAQTQRSLSSHSVLWALLFGVAIAVTTLLISYINRSVLKRPVDDPIFSWWVLYLGGALYGIGAVVAWIANWKP